MTRSGTSQSRNSTLICPSQVLAPVIIASYPANNKAQLCFLHSSTPAYDTPHANTPIMDSMRPLSNSLPRTRRRLDQPELLADFKAAALSVTNLYKSAAASQEKARAAGYQDAIEDLLAFLDKEDMGLMDGEGWRVRQWATERLPEDAVGLGKKAESEDDGEEELKAEERSSSPEVQRKPQAVPAMAMSSSDLTDENPRRSAKSEPPPDQLPTADTFTFTSNYAYPTNHDREGMDVDTATTINSSTPSTPHATSSETTTPASVRIMARPNRGRHTNHNRQRGTHNSNANGPTINLNLGTGAGSKRKLPYSDFFDISGINFEGGDRKDGSGGRGGGKRGRFV